MSSATEPKRARIDALIPARGHESSRPWALRRGIDADHALLLDPGSPERVTSR